ncbi:MAG: hypothetical protein AB8B50_21725 [Pirellulaceae bacterium]
MTAKENLNSRPPTWLAALMFAASLAFLILLSAVLVLWIDVVVEPAERTDLTESARQELIAKELAFEASAQRIGNVCAALLLVLWPAFLAEQFYNHLKLSSDASFLKHYPFWWLSCTLPPLRLCAQHRAESNEVWLPRFGWRTVNRELRKELERLFSIPMIFIALLILPVLGAHLLFKDRIIDFPALRIFLHIGTGLIWFAFTVEFIVMVSVAEKKLNYCKKHWLDLAIILLPLISFLRSLRALRIARVVDIGRFSQMSKFVRAYRLRGVAMRAFRALLVLEVLHRILRTKPEKRIQSLELQYAEKKRELSELREQIEALRAREENSSHPDKSE